jgi:hypothetical protein
MSTIEDMPERTLESRLRFSREMMAGPIYRKYEKAMRKFWDPGEFDYEADARDFQSLTPEQQRGIVMITVRFLGGEFIKHGAQQVAKNTVTNPKFPGFENVGAEYGFQEEWYSLKDFAPDIHVLSVIDSPAMTGKEYERPAFPSTWARKEGDGRVWYTAMGHREDVWTNPTFQNILVGGVKWALGDVQAELTPNLKETAPGAMTNPPYVEPPPPKPAKK